MRRVHTLLEGREVLKALERQDESVQTLVTTVRFTDLRITVGDGGRTSVAEVRGD